MIIAYSNQLVQCIAKVHLPFNEQHFWSCVIQVLTALFTAGMVLGYIGHVKETVEVVEEVVDQLTIVEVDEKNWGWGGMGDTVPQEGDIFVKF